MQRALLRRFTPTLRRSFSTVEETAKAGMTLNFSLPHETIYSGANVNQVIVPGAAGEYGVTADHVPLVAQLKPGVLQILHEGTSDAEKYFVAGGFSITHANSTTVSTKCIYRYMDWNGFSGMENLSLSLGWNRVGALCLRKYLYP